MPESTGTESRPNSGGKDTQSLPSQEAHQLLATFSHFFTVCIHNVLFYRGIYPNRAFIKARAYNTPVNQCRHPTVCAWIRDAVDAVHAQIAQGTVERLVIVIYDAKSVVLERWMFDIAGFPAWTSLAKPKKRKLEPIGEGEEGGEGASGIPDEEVSEEINWTDVEEQLRAALRRLAYAGEKLAPLPKGCTYTVAIELRDKAEAPMKQPQAWMPTKPTLQPASASQRKAGSDIGGAKTTSIRAIEAGPLFFECWVEESKAKIEMSTSTPTLPNS
ncbi:DNA-binding protein [Xylariaceae sp. FL1019]|nr:DNA-binding protein [Xylariaceae sp. FL1019]